MNNLCVLIIENESKWQENLKSPLRLLGESVMDVAKDYESAENQIQRKQYDLVVVDLFLPHDARNKKRDMRWGWEILEILRVLSTSNSNSLTILAIGDVKQASRAFKEYGVHDFIEKKDFDAQNFRECVSTAILKTRLKLAAARDQNCYRLNISFDQGVLLTIKLTGPDWQADYQVEHPQKFDMEDLARRADDLNWRILTGGAELWRPEARSIGQAIYKALRSERRILEHLSVARALTGQRLSNLWLQFSGPKIGLGVPFELLRDEGEDYIIFKHILTRRLTEYETKKPEPFHRFIENLHQKKEQPRILIVGVNSDGQIPAAEHEAKELAELMKASLQTLGFAPNIKLLLGKKASFTKVRKELEEKDYHVFHYAGHSRYDEVLPERSGLILPDGDSTKTLTIADLALLFGETESLRLVFLSCCLSARTAQHAGNGDFYGMMEAVAKADVPIVLGYRWSLADAPAQLLAKEFYQTLWRTLLPGEALLEARRKTALEELGRDDATWASPVLLVQTG